MAQSFRELVVWQRAMQLSIAVYRLTREFPRDELYGLTSQLRRSVVSIPSNIAEGQGRTSAGEFKQFLGIARGSNCEVQTQLEIARALNYGRPELVDDAESLSEEVRKMLFGMLDSLN
ncbi:MAG TPA: four helix bundle protein [Terracidiphilus sp.]|nr:four helix bundle protein [Terracidiphilus sp.]